MGFWSWLFGKKKIDGEEYQSEIIDIAPRGGVGEDGKKEYVGVKPKYEKIPRTKDIKDYVGSIVKKAENADSEPRPHDEGDVDKEKVEKFVKKIQGRNK